MSRDSVWRSPWEPRNAGGVPFGVLGIARCHILQLQNITTDGSRANTIVVCMNKKYTEHMVCAFLWIVVIKVNENHIRT